MSFLGELRIVLRRRDFRKLFAVRLVSQGGDGVFEVGLAGLIFFSPERQTTSVAAAAAFAASLLPYTVVGPFAGVLLDRWRRRQVLAVGNAVRFALSAVIAGLVLGHQVGPPLYALVLACLSINRFLLAGLGASLPHVVPRDELVMANAVSPTSGTLAFLAGGGLGYAVRTLLGAGDGTDSLVVLLGGLLWFAAAGLARRMGRNLLGPEDPLVGADRSQPLRQVLAHEASGVLAGLAAAARHVHHRRRAQYALTAIGAHRFGFGISVIASILLCRNHFVVSSDVQAGMRLLAFVFGASGVGFGVAAVLTPPGVRWLGTSGWVVTCFTAAAVVEATLVVALSVPTMVVAAFVLGIAAQGAKICVDSIVQREVHDDYRGRVFSFYDTVFNAAFVLAAIAAALVVPPSGYSLPLIAGIGVVYAATALWYAAVTRRAQPIRRPA